MKPGYPIGKFEMMNLLKWNFFLFTQSYSIKFREPIWNWDS